MLGCCPALPSRVTWAPPSSSRWPAPRSTSPRCRVSSAASTTRRAFPSSVATAPQHHNTLFPSPSDAPCNKQEGIRSRNPADSVGAPRPRSPALAVSQGLRRLFRFATYTGAQVVRLQVWPDQLNIVVEDRRWRLQMRVQRSCPLATDTPPYPLGVTRPGLVLEAGGFYVGAAFPTFGNSPLMVGNDHCGLSMPPALSPICFCLSNKILTFEAPLFDPQIPRGQSA